MMSLSSSTLSAAVETLHYLYPSTIFLFFFVATAVSIVTLQATNASAKKQQYHRGIFLSLVFYIAGSYIFEALTIGIYDAVHKVWSGSQDYNVYVLASAIVWTITDLILLETRYPVWFPCVGTWLIGMVSEFLLLILSNILQSPETWKDIVSILLQVSRLCVLGMLLYFYLDLRRQDKDPVGEDPERQPLLRQKSRSNETDTTGSGSGSAAKSSESTDPASNDEDPQSPENATAGTSVEEGEDDLTRKKLANKDKRALRLAAASNWFTFIKGFAIFWPWFFPVNNRRLQARFLGCGLCLLFGNIMNVLIPMQFGNMASAIAGTESATQGPWFAVGLYIFLQVLGSPAIIENLRYWLWLPVEQYGYQASNIAAFKHAMNMSADFHNETNSELMPILRSGESVTELIEMVCFEVIPKLIDLFVAVFYLYFLFGPYMMLTAFAMIVFFFYIMAHMIGRRQHFRRAYVNAHREEFGVEQEGALGWQTASYFNGVLYEIKRFGDAVATTCRTQYVMAIAGYAEGIANRGIMTIGMTIALYIAVYQVVVSKTKTLADFITLVAYWGRLSEPLKFFATLYKKTSSQMIQAEKLLELYQAKPTVVDLPNAKPLEYVTGSVRFSNVNFAYDIRKPVLKDISFSVQGGSTIALVGETGGGKTTILKLMFRFFDVNEGQIEIDNQDIKQVTLTSLRETIGTVPQDVLLFNDTIMHNVRYAKLDATDEEVYEACRGAAIHEKIVALPDGYNTKVGPRGVKLSGGEQQRVAIARAMLMNPKIILLDEATSAVDTETELHIQTSLATLCKGRTTFIVAHRLSTVMRADQILVIHGGSIIEQGTHRELIKKEGKYHSLWSKQVFFTCPEDADTEDQSVEASKLMEITRGESSEAPKLKADAPEVPPENRRTTSVTKNPGKLGQEEDQSKFSKDQREEQAIIAGMSAKRAGKRADRALQPDYDVSQSAKSQFVTSVSELAENETNDEETQTPALNTKQKRTRPPRRQQSKSEPFNPLAGTAAQAQESIRRNMDGALDKELTGTGSGDGSLPLAEALIRSERRVSAPSDPPSGTLRDLRGSARGGRPRRPRHWRLKKRNPSYAGSSSASGDTSGSSGAGVAVPVNTPAEVPVLQAPKIRFAPGS